MSELTRSEKIQQINTVRKIESSVYANMTCEEINDLYDVYFNKVTQEDFEGFKKVWNRFKIKNADVDGETWFIEDFKEELGL